MGLDMYMIRRKSMQEDVAYWRKANAILKWIEDHVADGELENCKEYIINREQLVELRDTCRKVIESSKLVYKDVECREFDFDKHEFVTKTVRMKALEDSSVAEELLPTQSGFLFGDVLYDENYVENLKSTIDQIDEILISTDFFNEEIVFHAWW